MFSKSLKDGEKLVQVWVYDEDNTLEDSSENWACHGRTVSEWDSKVKALATVEERRAKKRRMYGRVKGCSIRKQI